MYMAVLLTLALATHLTLCQGQGQDSKPALSWVAIPSFSEMTPQEKNTLSQYSLPLPECASQCSNEPTCSSFFHKDQAQPICQLYTTVYTEKSRMKYRQTGYKYYQLYDANCNVDPCYIKLRQEDMCLMFIKHHTGLNRDRSADLCSKVGGRLPILDTRKKSVLLKDMLDANTQFGQGAQGPFLGARYKTNRFLWDDDQEVAGETSSEGYWVKKNTQEPDANSCIKMNKLASNFGWEIVSCLSSTRFIMCEKNNN